MNASGRDRTRLLLIGLDGFEPALARAWMGAGELPNLAALARRGGFAILESTFPPVTYPAWSTFLTGAGPGAHGLFDFTVRLPGRYAVRFASGADRKLPTFFRILSDAGGRVAVLGVPTTYPPEPLHGEVIAGFDSPIATGIDTRFVHPRALYGTIRRVIGAWRFADFQELSIGPGWHDAARASLLDTIARKEKLALHLLAHERYAAFMVLFGESDTAGHHFWMFHDPASPRHDPAGARVHGDAIRQIYRRLDAAVGALVDAAGPGADVVVASDHGFGGAGDRAVHLNRWLEEEGWLAFRPARGAGARAADAVKRTALSRLPARAQEAAFRAAPGIAARLESATRFGGLDFRRTRAFSEELNYAPSLWLNLAGRDPEGTVPARDANRALDALSDRLMAWRDPFDGAPMLKGVYRREEIYRGPFTALAPDLLLDFNLRGGYSVSCLRSVAAGAGSGAGSVRVIEPAERVGGKGAGMNGSHRRDGSLFAAGPRIDVGSLPPRASIADVAPTALALLGVPAPGWMEGKRFACG
jgi:predicted AlkP superfamily phosphohydrolase/phosphomutase